MGWNFTIAQGGSIGSIIAIWTIAMLYIGLVMMTTEMASIMPEAGGQYTMAKYLLGPLAAFNVGLMLTLEYTMLEAANALVVGQILESLSPEIHALPYIILSLLFLAFMNYRGAYATLTLNFVITAVAFVSVIILLFSTNFYDPQTTLIRLKEMTNGLPYGFLGILAAMQFSIWFFLGIEGTALATDECRSANRSLPVGTMIGLATLLIGATITWFVCSGLLSAKTLGDSVYPLYDAALATGKLFVTVALFVGTILACLASANGCINDASRAWCAMSKDTLLPGFFYIAPMHPFPAILTLVLVGASLVGMYLNYWINMVSGAVFYLLASIWFLKRRAKFIDQDNFLRLGIIKWGKPKQL